ncbi:uncharacterized protein LOC108671266 [Hyalella azteca]|uniref:Uncharacterized protein LOC108671266 n=1 Tax=Hyalella azteca TaxID=294128 RepID=A0A8B7NLZ2_HYAAZ|nr:uncharacterized protein LOC108671266 [Hyalella azteca]
METLPYFPTSLSSTMTGTSLVNNTIDLLSMLHSNSNFSHVKFVPFESSDHGGSFIRATLEDLKEDSIRVYPEIDDMISITEFGLEKKKSVNLTHSVPDTPHPLARFGTTTVSRSSWTILGSVMVSMVIGLVLWVGILQYLGIPRSNRRQSYAAEKEVLDAIAQQVVDDLLRHRLNEEPSYFHSSIKKKHHIPFPVPVHAVYAQSILASDEKEARVSGGRLGAVEARVVMPPDTIISRRSGRGPIPDEEFFKPSPVDDVISNEIYSRKIPHKETTVLSDKNLNPASPVHPKSYLNQRQKLKQNNPIIILKPVSIFDPPGKINDVYDRKPAKPHDTSSEVLRPFAVDGHDNGKNKNLLQRNAKNIQLKSNLHKQGYSANYSKENEHHNVFPTEIPIRITTFRSNLRRRYFDNTRSSSSALDTRLLNLRRPVSLRSDHNSQDHMNDGDSNFNTDLNPKLPWLENRDSSESFEVINEYADQNFHDFQIDTKGEAFTNWHEQEKTDRNLQEKSFHNVAKSVKKELRNKIRPISIENYLLNHKFESSKLAALSSVKEPSVTSTESPAGDQNSELATQAPPHRMHTKDKDQLQGISDDLLRSLFPEFMEKISPAENEL